MRCDVLVLGGGISGLLLASELAGRCRLILVEQQASLPTHKYWLTSAGSLAGNDGLRPCLDTSYSSLDFLACDDTLTRIEGSFPLWDTQKLVSHLEAKVLAGGATLLTGRRFYSYRRERDGIAVRVDRETIHCRLLIDCMGYQSPIVTAESVLEIQGYYVLVGKTVPLIEPLSPVGLHNVMLEKTPTYLEVFPTSRGEAHVVLILAARQVAGKAALAQKLSYILRSSHYAPHFDSTRSAGEALFGVVPVGHLRRRALDRIFFFGEAGQFNPATSATGLTRMLYTYRKVAAFLLERLASDQLRQGQLVPRDIPAFSLLNRTLQEALFERLLDYSSIDFKRLVEDLGRFDPRVVTELIFGELSFAHGWTAGDVLQLLRRPNGVLAGSFLRALPRLPKAWLGSR